MDVPRTHFLTASEAWRRCRAGEADPALFGISFAGLFGLWFIAGNLVRDLAALNRVEMLPWDLWGAQPQPGDQLDPERLSFFDELARITHDSDTNFHELRSQYDGDESVRVPRTVFDALPSRQIRSHLQRRPFSFAPSGGQRDGDAVNGRRDRAGSRWSQSSVLDCRQKVGSCIGSFRSEASPASPLPVERVGVTSSITSTGRRVRISGERSRVRSKHPREDALTPIDLEGFSPNALHIEARCRCVMVAVSSSLIAAAKALATRRARATSAQSKE